MGAATEQAGRPGRRGSWVLGVLVVLAVVAGGACVEEPPYPSAQTLCPYGNDVVQVNGDSVGYGMASRLRPAGHTVVNAAQSRSGFTYEFPADFPTVGLQPVPSIVSAITDRIEMCGTPELLVVSGGINDISGKGLPAATVQETVVELADWLRDRNVPTLWVTIVPYPERSNHRWSYPQRQLFNQWLVDGGPGWGRTVDCVPALQIPSRPDVLRPEYEIVVDLFGGVDGVHPNAAGYRVFAACVQAAIG